MEIKVSVESVDLASPIGELAEYDSDNDYMGRHKPYTLGEAVAAQIVAELKKDDRYNGLKKQVDNIRVDEIREQIRPIVQAAIVDEIPQTNTYGERTGKTTTLKELIADEARKLLSKRDDYGRGPSYVQKIMAAEVDRAVKQELSQAIADEKAKVVAAVRAKAADLIANAVKEGIGR